MTEIVEIEKMSYGAEAVGHLSSGKVVFLEDAVPGDIASIEILEDKPSYARGIISNLVTPSVSRVASSPYLPKTIAPWAILNYETQLVSKQENVRDALLHVAHMDCQSVDNVLEPIVPSACELNYRNKIELAAITGNNKAIELGFSGKDGQKTLFSEKNLDIACDTISSAPYKITGALRYALDDDGSGLFRVGIRGSKLTNSVEVALWTKPGPFPRKIVARTLIDAVSATSVVRVIADEGASRKVKGVEVLAGPGFWSERACGLSKPFSVSAPSFFQVNTQAATRLVSDVMSYLGDVSNLHIADLYSGVGMFSIPLSLAGAKVCAIEIAGSSTRDLKRHCKVFSTDINVVCDDVSYAFAKLGNSTSFDVVIVDPPRLGLEKRALNSIASAAPNTIVYVSCDPQTLSRDIARFLNKGYSPVCIRPYDLFPQTWHVETLCILRNVV